MASKPETNFTRRITKLLPDSIYHMKNNNMYVGGVPDLWLSGNKADLWCEMKYIKPLPVSVPIRPAKLLSALQMEWLNSRYDQGRHIAVIIGCEAGGVILQNKEWEKDIPIERFKSILKSPRDLADWIKEQITKSE